jgi:hypothetical protein
MFNARSSRVWLAMGLAALALLGGVLGYRSLVSQSPAPLTLKFTPGAVLGYRVAWSGVQRGRLFEGGNARPTDTHATTRVDMALDVEWHVEAVQQDEAVLLVSVTGVDRHELRVLETDLFPSREEALAVLGGRQARVRLGLDGVPREVRFQEGAPELFMNMVQWMVGQATVSLGKSGEPSWEAEERGPFGSSLVRYERTGEELTRARLRYLSFDAFASGADTLAAAALDGRSHIRLRAGLLERVRSDETVRVDARAGGTELEGQTSFELSLRSIGRATRPPALVTWAAPMHPGEPVVGRETAAQLLDQRIGGMTAAQMLAELKSFANGGMMPQHTLWLWRATGLLKRDPALAAELVSFALAKGTTGKGRALALDMLASVGHAEAQAAMRAILGSPVLASSAQRPTLLQRISFLEAPERETIDLVVSSLRAGKQEGWGDLVYASAHALASASRAAAANGDDGTARQLVRSIAEELAAAQTPEASAALLGALTNATGAEVATIAQRHATSEDPRMRGAAASAVRKVDNREATEMLLALLGDSNAEVQAAALASLGDRKLSEETWRHVATLATSGRIPGSLDGMILNLAASYVSEIRVVTQVVAVVAARPDADPATRARARNMLERAPG